MPKQTITSPKVLLSCEAEVQAVQKELFGRLSSQPKKLFSRKGWYGRLLQWTLRDPDLKTALFRFVDVFPSLKKPADVSSFLKEYLKPKFFNQALGIAPARLTSAFISQQMKAMAGLFIIGENISQVRPALKRLRQNNTAFTLDLLGEKVLSEKEAGFYQTQYLNIIRQLSQAGREWPFNPLIDQDDTGPIPKVNISIKISSLDSLIAPVSWDDSKDRIKNKLRPILKTAKECGVFINIDTEQYHYKSLTLEVFKELIMEAEFAGWPHVGIVVQAYLRDSLQDVKSLAALKQPMVIRLVKGAYWDYELIQARQKNQPPPVYLNKAETDDNFSLCAREILQHRDFLRLAVGSHNTHSIASAVYWARRFKVPLPALEIQMLYGMSEPFKQVLIQKGFRFREYCPMGLALPGMAYLVRRLLENTANESILTSGGAASLGGGLKPQQTKSPIEQAAPYGGQATPFGGTALKPQPAESPIEQAAPSGGVLKPQQTKSPIEQATPFRGQAARYAGAAVLDFTLGEHRRCFRQALQAWKVKLPLRVPVVVDRQIMSSAKRISRCNPSILGQVVVEVSCAQGEHCERAMKSALGVFSYWSGVPVQERAQVLKMLADKIEKNRYSLAALQVLEVGKTWVEADADVCEAIDFCRYYAERVVQICLPRLTDNILGEESFCVWRGRGPAVVIAPWNFPLAILTGMTAACLAGGNPVLIKPAEQSTGAAFELMKLLMECGVPKGVVQFLPGLGEEAGAYLVQHKDTAVIAFTGSKETGLTVLEQAFKRSLGGGKVQPPRCVVEMGGKNAIIIDESADLDEAAEGVLESAFGFQGQKCSACSRVFVPVSLKEHFTKRLAEAVSAWPVGNPENPEVRIGPVIDRAAVCKINKYIKEGQGTGRLHAGGVVKGDGLFIPPVIFSDLPCDSPLLREEIFGPVLVIISFSDLDKAVKEANSTEFALTGGFYCRSPSRIERVKRSFQVGNLYINRSCTGAVVKRHPFGGFKMSGLGHKAGGPDYLKQFMNPVVATENTVRKGGFTPHLLG